METINLYKVTSHMTGNTAYVAAENQTQAALAMRTVDVEIYPDVDSTKYSISYVGEVLMAKETIIRHVRDEQEQRVSTATQQ